MPKENMIVARPEPPESITAPRQKTEESENALLPVEQRNGTATTPLGEGKRLHPKTQAHLPASYKLASGNVRHDR